ncbi:MAG: TonB-dependent receptor [Saprospiraceae bacterium]
MLRLNSLVFTLTFCVFHILLLQSQSIQGKLLVDGTKVAASGVKVMLENKNRDTYTNISGEFSFSPVSFETYVIKAIIDLDTQLIATVTVDQNLVDLGEILVKSSGNTSRTVAISIVDFADLIGIESENDNFSGLLNASQDVISNTAAFNLSYARFRIRGYFNEDSELMLNGMPMNDLDDGRILWNAWGGLNDVFRAQSDIQNLQPNEYGFGGIGGIRMIDLRASDQRKQNKAVYTFSNRTYQHRAMFTHSSGMKKSGWAYSLSASTRLGTSGYIEGTNMSGVSYFASVDKKIGKKHLLNVVFFGAPVRRGRSTGAIQEVYDITNNNYYNPNWGYQNGEVRNSREYITNQPITMIRHDFEVNSKLKITSTIGFQFGEFGSTRLDWYDAPDPRPDYYRKLPSYYKEDPVVSNLIRDNFVNDVNVRQINWDQLYDANRNRFYTIQNVDGIPGNNVSGKLAAYIQEQEHFDNEKRSFNSVFTYVQSRKFTLNGGVQYLNDITHNYREVVDLMGADFYVDYDRFSLTAFPDNPNAIQNDLNNPNRILKVGDVFGHNYDINLSKALTWMQGQFTTRKMDYFLSLLLSNTSFYRDGFTKNGRFPEESFGKGEVHSFLNYGLKGGATYKLNGNNYISARATYRTRAPFSRQAYLSPRIRDGVVNGISSEDIFSSDVSYELRYPWLKGRISAYYTTFKNQISNDVFYHDDLRTFVNYAMTGIDKKHIGVEMGLDIKLNSVVSLVLMGNIAEYIYTSRPFVTINRDNSAEVLVENREVFLENYYVGGLPQKAAVIGLDMSFKKFWRVNIDVNGFTDTYIDPNPDRRTREGVDLVDPIENSELYNEIIGQERLPGGITLDLGVYKSWKVTDGQFIRFNANVSNVLNNTTIRNGGFEQLRYDFTEKDVDLFPTRYFYAFGTNYTVSVSYLF